MQNSFVHWDVEKTILAVISVAHRTRKVFGSGLLSAMLKIIWLSQENTTANAK
jgi:hypothetical protein